jgi:hypothetical protein
MRTRGAIIRRALAATLTERRYKLSQTLHDHGTAVRMRTREAIIRRALAATLIERRYKLYQSLSYREVSEEFIHRLVVWWR